MTDWVTGWVMELHHWSAGSVFNHWLFLWKNDLAQTGSKMSSSFKNSVAKLVLFTLDSQPFQSPLEVIFFPTKSPCDKSSDSLDKLQLCSIEECHQCCTGSGISLKTHLSMCVIQLATPHLHRCEWAANFLSRYHFRGK